MTVLAVTGLAAEARIASGPAVRCICAGNADRRALAAWITSHLDRSVRGLVSFGFAGALAPGLGCGTWLLARTVRYAGQRWEADERWTACLSRLLPHAQCADIAGSDEAVLCAEDKRALHSGSGAVAVDMESHRVAEVAQREGLPFAAFRVVLDAADCEIPRCAASAMGPQGRIDVMRLINALLQEPGQVSGLLRLAPRARAAKRRLSAGRRLLGEALGRPDFDQLLLHMA